MTFKMIERIISVIFPNRCPYCNKIIGSGLTECEDCFKELCKTPKISHTDAGIICISPFFYDSKVRQSILKYKFRGVAFNARSYAKAMCSAVESAGIKDDFDIITFVPLSKSRERERGFNQSRKVAEIVADCLNKPCRALLEKTKNNKNQHDLNLIERRENVKGVYSVCKNEDVKGMRILLIDDIVTTGNTMSECCNVLKDNGAENVICMSIATATLD